MEKKMIQEIEQLQSEYSAVERTSQRVWEEPFTLPSFRKERGEWTIPQMVEFRFDHRTLLGEENPVPTTGVYRRLTTLPVPPGSDLEVRLNAELAADKAAFDQARPYLIQKGLDKVREKEEEVIELITSKLNQLVENSEFSTPRNDGVWGVYNALRDLEAVSNNQGFTGLAAEVFEIATAGLKVIQARKEAQAQRPPKTSGFGGGVKNNPFAALAALKEKGK